MHDDALHDHYMTPLKVFRLNMFGCRIDIVFGGIDTGSGVAEGYELAIHFWRAGRKPGQHGTI